MGDVYQAVSWQMCALASLLGLRVVSRFPKIFNLLNIPGNRPLINYLVVFFFVPVAIVVVAVAPLAVSAGLGLYGKVALCFSFVLLFVFCVS